MKSMLLGYIQKNKEFKIVISASTCVLGVVVYRLIEDGFKQINYLLYLQSGLYKLFQINFNNYLEILVF